MIESLREYVAVEGIEASVAGDGLAAKHMLGEDAFDAVVTDLRMPGLDGLGLLRWIREEGPPIPVVIISAHGDVRDAVEAMKLGAYDYLVKPFDPDELVIRLRKAVEERRTSLRLAAGMLRFGKGGGLVGESSALVEVIRLIDKVAPTASTVLITGESGTGKEVAARLIHERSGRDGSYVAVNLGALPENLLESELFGHEKGAFTGADARKAGLFETAHAGTIFLDEIGELPLHLQVKLLRAIQERKVQRLGGLQGIPIDARLVAATNRDLEAEVRAGRFREDLYYRINVIRIRMPPLRERAGDRALLAGFFLKKLSAELGRKVDGISAEALGLIEGHDFPGNVRELENAIERALILSEGPMLEARDFQFFIPGAMGNVSRDAAGRSPRSLVELEKRAIAEALERNGYHREKSAAELGITRRTLLNKIKDYGLEIPGSPQV
jgi:DNA-binding NtrC family response regulator